MKTNTSLVSPLSTAPWLRRGACVLAALTLPLLPVQASSIIRTNNADTVDLGTAWIGGVAPGLTDVATWNGLSTGGVQTTAADVFWGGIFIGAGTPVSSVVLTGGNLVTLGSNGISLNGGLTNASNRGINISNAVDMVADQTWQTSIGSSANANVITINGPLSGAAQLTVSGNAGTSLLPGYVRLNNSNNSFSGGFVLSATGAVLVGAPAFGSGGTLLGNPLGTGDIIIEGGSVLPASGSMLVAQSGRKIWVSNDFAIGQVLTNGTKFQSIRMDVAGTFDLGSVTRTITLGNIQTTASNSVNGANASIRFGTHATIPAVIDNGTLRLAIDPDADTNSFWVAAVIGQGGALTFNNDGGLTLGNKVITAFPTSTIFPAGGLPNVTLEAGSYFNLANGTFDSRSPSIRSLSGTGTVVNNNTSNFVGTGTLTIDTTGATNTATFFGSIRNRDTSIWTNATNGVVALTKVGLGTQRLAGTNTYSGKTTVSAGTLKFVKLASLADGNTNLWTTNTIQVNSGGTFGLNVGAVDEFDAGHVAQLLSIASSASGFRTGAKLALDTENTPGGVFAYDNVLANPSYIGGTNTLSLIKQGSNELYLSQANTFSGGYSVEAGSLRVTQRGGVGSGTGFINSGTAVIIDLSAVTNQATFANTLTGSGTLVVRGPEFVVPGSNTVITLQNIGGFAGTLIAASTSTNSGRVDINSTLNASLAVVISNGASVKLADAATISDVDFTVGGLGTTFNSALRLGAGGLLDSLCTVTLATTNASIGVTSGTSTIDAAITGGANGLTKSAGGRLVLNGANTYTGPTFVNSGILELNGTSPLATGLVTVSSASTLNGTGSAGGDASISGTIGAQTNGGVGTLTLGGALTLGATATNYWDWNGSVGDVITAGSINVTAGWRLVVNAPGLTNGTYTLMTAAGGITLGGQPTLDGPSGSVTVLGGTALVYNAGAVLETPFQQWQTNYFGTTSNPNGAPSVDFDQDGANNLLEYAFGTSPVNPASTVLPQVGSSGNFLTITVPRNAAATDLSYQVQGSTDLLIWATNATYSATSPAPAGSTVTYTNATPFSSQSHQFLRVNVQLQ